MHSSVMNYRFRPASDLSPLEIVLAKILDQYHRNRRDREEDGIGRAGSAMVPHRPRVSNGQAWLGRCGENGSS